MWAYKTHENGLQRLVRKYSSTPRSYKQNPRNKVIITDFQLYKH